MSPKERGERRMRTGEKLRSRKGTTIVEMMAAVVIMVLLSMMLNTGFGLLMNAYHSMTAASEAKTLLSMAGNVATEELRFAARVSPVANGIQYDSDSFEGMVLKTENGKLVTVGPSGTKQLLAGGAYGAGDAFRLELASAAYDSTGGVVTFTLKVKEGEKIRAEREFQVRCLNSWEE